MEMIPRNEVAEAVSLAIDATLHAARPPRLSASEHGALVALQSVALILGLDAESARMKELFRADSTATRDALEAALKGYPMMGGSQGFRLMGSSGV